MKTMKTWQTRKGKLTRLESKLTDLPWKAARATVSVKLLGDEQDTCVYVESKSRVLKERSMRRHTDHDATNPTGHGSQASPPCDARPLQDVMGRVWLEQVLRTLGAGSNCFFWRTHAGAEIDLIVPTTGGTLGFEFKASFTPTITRGTREAMSDAQLDQLFVIHGGEQELELGEKMLALLVSRLATITRTQ